MEKINYEYLVENCNGSDAKVLQEMLNSRSAEGWELYMLQETDSRDGKVGYNLIFCRTVDEHTKNLKDTVDIDNFRKQIEDVFSSKSKDRYQEWFNLTEQIVKVRKQIEETKKKIDSIDHLGHAKEEYRNFNHKLDDLMRKLMDLTNQRANLSNPNSYSDDLVEENLVVYVSNEIVDIVDPNIDGKVIPEVIKIRHKCLNDWGYVLPEIHYKHKYELETNEYVIEVRGVPVASGSLHPKYRMFYKGTPGFAKKPPGSVKDVDPLTQSDVYWVADQHTEHYWDRGLTAEEVLAKHLEYICFAYAEEILDYKSISLYVDKVYKTNEELVNELIPDALSLVDLKAILANLLKEYVPIKNLSFIFEKILDAVSVSDNREDLIASVRSSLARQISYLNSDENNTISVLALSEDIEIVLLEKIVEKEDGTTYLELDSKVFTKLLDSTKEALKSYNNVELYPIILTSQELRSLIFNAFRLHIPGIRVLSREEISGEYMIHIIAKITLAKEILRKMK